MLRGVRIDGTAVSSLRRSRALSQKKLAKSAGVSERTIRNAERSSALESHIALYIATALDVPLTDIVAERPTPSRASRLHQLARRIGRSYLKSVINSDFDQLARLLHPHIEWNSYTAPIPGFGGLFCGTNEVTRHLRNASEWWEKFTLTIADFKFNRIDAEGDMLYFLMTAGTSVQSQEPMEIWQSFICRSEEGLLITVDHCLGLCGKRSQMRERIS